LRPSSPLFRQRRRSASPSDSAQYALPFVIETIDSSPDTPELVPRPLVPLAPPGERSEPVAQPVERDSEVPPTRGQNPKRGRTDRPHGTAISPEAKLLVSRNVAAEMLSISVRGVDYMIAARRLSTRRIANRVLIPTEEIRKFIRSDHPGRMAGLPGSKVNHSNVKEAGNAAKREPEDATPSASRSRRSPPVETGYVNHRYRKPTHGVDRAEHRGDLPESADTG